MYAAVSGLKAHMSALNVIGNNVSNVNTTAYKATRYTFNEALYTTTRTGSDGTDVSGGRNPAQVGFGSSIGTIDLDMSTKNYSPTGQALDTMIDGDGFFIVGDKVTGPDAVTKIATSDLTTLKGMNLTRMGNFNIDPNGFLVDGNGSVVWGFTCTQAAKAYKLETGASVNVTIADDGTITYPEGSSASDTKLLTEMTKDDIKTLNSARKLKGLPELTNVEYTEKLKIDPATKKPIKDAKGNTVPETDSNGNIIMVVKSASVPSTDLSTIRMPVLKKTTDMVKKDPAPTGATGRDLYEIPANAQSKSEIMWMNPEDLKDGGVVGTVEFEEYDIDASTKGGRNIEYVRLESDSVSIDEKTGALRIMTSDGTLYTVGYLALAKVTNPNGVTHVDGRYYQAQDGAGNIRVTSVKGSIAGTESSGDTALITGGLESSGTDLATEITNMITVQRGYQANTRIVTVTDSMLEELVNMKR